MLEWFAALGGVAAAACAAATLAIQTWGSRPRLRIEWVGPTLGDSRMRDEGFVALHLDVTNIRERTIASMRVVPLLDGKPAPERLAGPISCKNATIRGDTLYWIQPGATIRIDLPLRSPDDVEVTTWSRREGQRLTLGGELDLHGATWGAELVIGRFSKFRTTRPDVRVIPDEV